MSKNQMEEGEGDIIFLPAAHQHSVKRPSSASLIIMLHALMPSAQTFTNPSGKKGIITVGLNERSLMGIPL